MVPLADPNTGRAQVIVEVIPTVPKMRINVAGIYTPIATRAAQGY